MNNVIYYIIYLSLLLIPFCLSNQRLEHIIGRLKIAANSLLLEKLSTLDLILLSQGRKLHMLLGSITLNNSSKSLPKYKFYTELIYDTHGLARKFGTPSQSILMELRKGIGKDLRLEQALRGELLSAFVQFIIMTTITWAFIHMTQQMVEIRVGVTLGFIILFIQCSGLIFYLLAAAYLRSRKTRAYGQFIQRLYSFSSLVRVGLPCSRVIELSEIQSLWQNQYNNVLDSLSEQLMHIVKQWKDSGAPINDQLSQIVDETWYQSNNAYDELKRHFTSLKFLTLTVFYLSAYFVFLFSLYRAFLIE